MLYLFETGAFPHFLNSNRLKTKFRNDVVHASKIPSIDETVAYADLVFELIRSLLIELYNIAVTCVTADLKKKKAQVVNKADIERRFCTEYAFDGMFDIGGSHPKKQLRLTTNIRQIKHPTLPRLRLVATNTCSLISTSKNPWRPGNAILQKVS